MRPRWRKVIADLWENKARTLLVIASISIGVFAVGMIVGSYVMIPEGMNTSYANAKPANIRIFTDAFDDDFLEGVQRMDGVAIAEGRRSVTVRVRTGPNEWQNLELLGIPDFTDQQINTLTPVSGASMPEDQQIILIPDALEELNTQYGAMLEIELIDGTIKHMPVVGIARDLTRGVDGMLNKSAGYITFDTLTWLHEPDNYDQLLIITGPDPNDEAHIQQVANDVSNRLEDTERQVYRTQQSTRNAHPLGYIVQAVLGVLGLLGVLIVFLSSSLIANTLNSLLTQQTRQIGVMKLVGARSNQIISMYLQLIFILGVISLLISIPAGSFAAFYLSTVLSDFINITLAETSPVPFIPLAVIVQTAIAMVVPIMAGLYPVIGGARVTVQKAISSSGMGGDDEPSRFDSWLETLRWVKGSNTISIRNTFRRKGRLFLTLFTLALGGAIFIAVFNVQIALNQKAEDITKYFTADVNMDFDRSYLIEEIRQYALEIPGVVHVEGWATAGAEMLNPDGSVEDTITILAPPADTDLVDPIMLEGRWVVPGDEKALVVNEAFWDIYPDLHPGDYLRIKLEGREEDWLVVGVFQYAGLDQLFSYATYTSLSQTLNTPNRAASYRMVATQHDRESQEQLGTLLDDHFRSLGFQVRDVEAGQAFVETVTEMLGILILILIMLALMTAAVGSIGLAGTLSMNVLERTREIGVLRAIGAYDRVVIKLVVVEGLIIGLISFILGATLSFPITSVLSDIISEAIFNSPANFAFTLNGFIIWSIIVLALSVLASVIPARSAARMTIREVLAYE